MRQITEGKKMNKWALIKTVVFLVVIFKLIFPMFSVANMLCTEGFQYTFICLTRGELAADWHQSCKNWRVVRKVAFNPGEWVKK